MLITDLKAITFNTITLRIKLQAAAESSKSITSGVSAPVQTIGSIPMKRIHVNIDREVDDDTQYDDRSYTRDKP